MNTKTDTRPEPPLWNGIFSFDEDGVDIFEGITLPVEPVEGESNHELIWRVGQWLYDEACKHCAQHFSAHPGSYYGDLRAFLGKEAEWTLETLGFQSEGINVNDLHYRLIDLIDNYVYPAFEDTFGDDIYE